VGAENAHEIDKIKMKRRKQKTSLRVISLLTSAALWHQHGVGQHGAQSTALSPGAGTARKEKPAHSA